MSPQRQCGARAKSSAAKWSHAKEGVQKRNKKKQQKQCK